MAKPFALPDPPGPGGGGASSSGAGPPAGSGPSNVNQTGAHPGYHGPNQQHQQPPQSAPPGVSHGHGGAFPMAGPGGHVASTPIPVTGGNNHYYHHYAHHHPQPLYHQPQQNFYYPGPYPSGPYAVHPVGGASAGGSAADPPQHPMPHVMTPPNSAFAHPPHQGQANGELVQALYEALHRCGVRESPPTPLSHSPPSASCSPPATAGYCAPPQTFFPRTPASAPPIAPNGGRLFFQPSTPGPGGQYPRPPSQPTPLSANSHSSSSGISSSLDTPSCSSGTPHYVQSRAQPVLFNWQDDGDSSESEGGSSPSQATSSSGCSPSCFGLDESESSAAGSLTPSSGGVASPASSGVTVYGVVPPHLDTYMARREQLQEFPGKIPQRKRRSRTPKPKKSRFLEKPLMWQMAVTAALIALGCGYFAGR